MGAGNSTRAYSRAVRGHRLAGPGHPLACGLIVTSPISMMFGAAGGATNDRTQPGEHFVEIEGLDGVVVRPESRPDAIGGGIARRQHEDGRLLLRLTQTRRHVPSVGAASRRKDRVVVVHLPPCRAVFSIPAVSRGPSSPGPRQRLRKQIGLILDDPGAACHSREPGNPSLKSAAD